MFMLQWILIKQYDCFKLVYYSKTPGRLSSVGPEILAFGSHCLAKFQTILDCFIPHFKLKYEDSENVKANRIDVVIFKLHQIKQRKFFGTPGKVSKN